MTAPRRSPIEEDAEGTAPGEASQLNNDGRPQLGLFELLDIDDRPTLVFDLTNSNRTPIYRNASLGKIPLLGLKLGDGVLSTTASSIDVEYTAFLEWAASSQEGGSSHRSYWGLWWSAHTLQNRWRIVTGADGDEYEYISARRRQSEVPRLGRAHTGTHSRPSHSPSQSQSKFVSDDSLEAQIAAFRLREGRPPSKLVTRPLLAPESIQNSETLDRLDFFRAYPAVIPSPLHEFVMEFDWASTELGPISSWSKSLRRKTSFLMSDPRPAAMFWGKQRTMMYNEPYMRVTGQKHPGMMGKIFSEAWGEVEGDLIPAFEKAYTTGAATVLDDARFYIERSGYIEETYFSFAMIPFLAENDEIAL